VKGCFSVSRCCRSRTQAWRGSAWPAGKTGAGRVVAGVVGLVAGCWPERRHDGAAQKNTSDELLKRIGHHSSHPGPGRRWPRIAGRNPARRWPASAVARPRANLQYVRPGGWCNPSRGPAGPCGDRVTYPAAQAGSPVVRNEQLGLCAQRTRGQRGRAGARRGFSRRRAAGWTSTPGWR